MLSVGCVEKSYFFFLLSSHSDTLFNRAPRNKAKYTDLLGLPQSVGAVHCLTVYRRIPVAIVENDGIG